MKSKKVVALVVILSIAVVLTAFLIYSYYTPNIELTLGKPVDPNAKFYTENVTFSYSEKFGMPLPKKIKSNFTEFSDKTTEVYKDYSNYIAPTDIHAKVQVIGRQTIITFSGTATTKDGKNVDYNKQLTFDFVLTRNISYELLD